MAGYTLVRTTPYIALGADYVEWLETEFLQETRFLHSALLTQPPNPTIPLPLGERRKLPIRPNSPIGEGK